MAIKKVIEIDVNEQGAVSGIDNLNKAIDTTEKSTKSLRTQLREAQLEVATLSEKFGATSQEAVNAAKKAALLKDAIGDAKALTDAFNPDAKFSALSGSLTGVAGGFAAVQGGLGLIGAESENVEKLLLRVNSAMALSQGLQALGESVDSFKQLGAVATNALKGIRSGLAATGIGLFLVALGTVVAYWDDIKEAVSGVTEEQEKAIALTKEQTETTNKQLESVLAQEETLKRQGKTEKEIAQIKLKAYNDAIKAKNDELKAVIAVRDAELAGAKRNFEFLKKLINIGAEFSLIGLRAIAFQADLIIGVINKASNLLGKGNIINFNANDFITKTKNQIANFTAGFIFDVAETDAKTAEDIEKARLELIKLQNSADAIVNEQNKRQKEAKAKKVEKPKLEDSPELIREQMIAKARMDMDKALAQNKIEQEKLRSNAVIEANNKILENSMYLDKMEKEFNEERIQERYKMLDNLAYIFGAETDLGKAALIAKQALMAKELFLEIKKTITFATLTEAKAGASTASGVAETAKVGFPQNIPLLIAYAAQAFGIMSSVKAAVSKVKSATGAGGGGGGSFSSTPTVSQAPSFNLIGNTGVNQIAQTIAGQTQPVKAYVVAKDVSTQQELDRNKVNSVRIG